MFCPECGFEQAPEDRFCFGCGLAVSVRPSMPSKTTQLFLGFPTQSLDQPDAVLRVSRYRDGMLSQPDGSTRLVPRHTRISIWAVDRAVGAISLGPDETQRLRSFLAADRDSGRRVLGEAAETS
jgi:hypothetical protein